MEASVYGFIALLILAFIGVPLALAMLLVGAVGFAAVRGWSASYEVVGQTIVDTGMSYGFSVVPLFILMGTFVHRSRISEELFETAFAWLGHHRGGLAMATIAASGGFSAVSGSSIATAATIAKVAFPPMRRYGYAEGLAAGSIAAGGTLGILIPPSIVMAIYGLIADQDIGKLFIAGIIPGVLTVALYLVTVATVTYLVPEQGPRGPRASWNERLRSLAKTWRMLSLFLLVLGGIYFGVFTPTEAAGIGAAGALALALLSGRMTWRMLFDSLVESGRTSAMLFAVVFGGLVFAQFTNIAGMPSALHDWVLGLGLAPMLVIVLIVGIYLVLGCVMDAIAMILLTVPVFYPLVAALGYDLIWFGVLVVVVAEVGMITPPIGMNVFVLKSILPEVSLVTIFRGVAPFWVADLLRIGLFVLFPGIALLLPSLMP
jgi:tripartite ATP-independent transporter DctM subunit